MTRNTTVALVALGIALALEGSVTALGDGGVESHAYTYFKTPIPLSLDTSRMVVRAPAALDVAAMSRDVAVFGIAANDVTAGPLHGWYSIRPPIAVRSDEGIRALTAELARLDVVEFVSSVFMDEQGFALMITQGLLVGFSTDVPAALAEAVLDATGAGAILEREYAHMPGVYQLVACDDDNCGSPSSVTFQATGSTVYMIRVGGKDAGNAGTGCLEIEIACDA